MEPAMPDSPFIALVHNAALLLALVLVYDLVVSRYPLAKKPGRQLIIGVVLGSMGVGIMLAPFQLVPGIVFDTRSVLLAVSGLFFGFMPTLVAMLLTAAYRLSQGGAAAWVGVAVIFASGSLGLLWRRRHRPALAALTWRHLYGLGLAVHIVMLLLMLTLGWNTGRDVLQAIGLPVLVIYPVATTALGLLLANQLRREQAATAQQESEQRWQFALEGAGDGVWDWDVPANTVFFSKRWKQMLGYADHEIGRGLEEWSGRVHPEDLPGTLAAVQAHIEGRTAAYTNEHRVRCKDGGYRWIHDRGLVVSRDAGGKARRMVGTHTDITARKDAEAASARQRQELQVLVRQLENSRGMLQSIIESIPVRVFWKDKDLRYQGCNSLFAHDAGFLHPAELQGKDDHAMGWSAQAERYQKDDREVMATGLPKLNIIEPQTTPAGATIWLNTSKVPLKDSDGAVVGILGIYTDITARIQMEHELRESQLLYRSFVEQLPMPVFRKDRAGRYVMVNPVFCRIKGLPAEEFLGRTAPEVAARQVAGPDPDNTLVKYAAEGDEAHAEIMLTGKMVETEEEYTGADGKTTYLHVLRMPVLADDGTVAGIQCIQIDFTSRKLAEARLAEANRVLQAEMEERARAVARARAAQDEMARLLAVAEQSRRALLSVVEDHQAAEQALRESEAMLKDAQNIASLGSYVLDITTGRWRSSAVLDRVFGIDPAFERSVAGWEGLIHPEDRTRVSAYLRDEVIGRQQPFNREYRVIRHSDRAERWVQGLGKLDFDARGRPRHMQGTIQDITERKRAETALRESEERFRALFESSLDGFLITVPTGEILAANPAACAMLRRTEAEICALGRTGLVDAEDPRLAPLLEERRRTGKTRGELTFLRGDGTRFEAEISSAVFGTGAGQRNGMVLRDITLQVAARETLERFNTELEQMVGQRTGELATRNREIQALLIAIPDTVMRLRADGTILHSQPAHASPALATITPGEQAVAAAGEPAALVAASLDLGRRALAAGTTTMRETEIATPGGPLALELRTAPTGPDEFVVFARDITARKRLESETAAMLEKERQVAEMRTRFISVISHEFRTPLTAIIGSVELLANHLDHLSPEKRTEIFERIDRSQLRMTAMLDDVLTLNRLDADRTEVRLGTINLGPYVQNIIAETQAADHDAHRFAVHLPANPAPFVTDPNLLHHILSNLLGNAVRYSPAGSTVTVRVECDAWRLHLSVEDQGIGIPPADRARIFEPFERGSNVGHIKGTGLGLNIVRRMTVLLGGQVTLRPVAGGGTRFSLAFPLLPPPSFPAAP
jgi:PAS domain S-box-containing protein